MDKRNSWRTACAFALTAAALAACGGGGGDPVDPVAGFQNGYAAPLAQAASPSTLTSASFQDSFATNYLDAGTTRAQVVDALGKDAAATTASTDFSSFPVASLTNVTVGDCGSDNICTATGTLTNSDADATTVPFTAKVVLERGIYRVLGDQKSS
jgi:hypothetical protein